MGTVQIYVTPCAKSGVIYLAFAHYTNLESFNVHKLVVSAEAETSSLYTLAANAELLDKVEVCLTVFRGNVLQMALALTNELQQPTTSGKVLLVHLKVLSKFLDAFGGNANLYSCAASVAFALLQSLNGGLFLLTCNHTLSILTDQIREFKHLSA